MINHHHGYRRDVLGCNRGFEWQESIPQNEGKVLLEVERLTVSYGGAFIGGSSIDTGITVNSPEPHDECCLYCACQTLEWQTSLAPSSASSGPR